MSEDHQAPNGSNDGGGVSANLPSSMSASRRSVMKAALAGAAGGLIGDSVAAQDGATPIPSESSSSDERPNILVFIVDEMRDWQWFPEQDALNQAFPNLARLQTDAVRFGRHYTASNMCTPSRGTLVTGLYSHQTGVMLTLGANVTTLTDGEDGATPGAEANATPAAVAPPYPVLDPRFPTWGTLLRDQGYDTWWWGKWHLNDETCDLEQYGFAGGTCPSPDGGPGAGMVDDPAIADQAISWLQEHGDGGPWCTTVSFVNPHDIQWYPRWTEQIDGQDDPPSLFDEMPPNFETAEDLAREGKPRLQLAAMMGLVEVFGALPHRGPGFERGWLKMLDLYHQLHGYLDREIGRVLDALEANPEVADNTIIVFTSDHGEYCGSHGLRGKGAGIYEEGIRVPLWVKDPTGRLADQPETVRTQITSSVDLAPMLLTIASGGNDWREDPDHAHLAGRLDLTSVLEDAYAPGRSYAVHATDEDGYEFGPVLLPVLQDAPFHVLGLVTDDAKLGVYTHWADDSAEIMRGDQEIEFYDATTEEGRLELVNTAARDNPRFTELYQVLMNEAVPNELRATLPDALEAARQEAVAAAVTRIAYDKATAEG